MNIDEIKERLANRTQGEWVLDTSGDVSGEFTKHQVIAKVGRDQTVYTYNSPGGRFPEQDRIFIKHAPADIKALIEAVEAREKKSHEIWGALKEQTKELARAYAKIETTKERIWFALDYLPESPNKAMGFLKGNE